MNFRLIHHSKRSANAIADINLRHSGKKQVKGSADVKNFSRLLAVVSTTVAVSVPSVASVAQAQSNIPKPTGQWIDAGSNELVNVSFQPVNHIGSNAKFWMRVVFQKPLPMGDRIQLMFQDAQCNSNTYTTRYIARFDSQGRLIDQSPIAVGSGVSIDSPAGVAFNASCGRY